MLYAMLIYQAEEILDGYSPEDTEATLAGHRALQAETKAAGHFREANQLLPSSSATTVRLRSGKISVTDGPFAETKELLIGLYVFDCANLEEAIDYAAKIPDCATGAIEIRPIAYLETIESVQGGSRNE
jgi:hypothetical protein